MKKVLMFLTFVFTLVAQTPDGLRNFQFISPGSSLTNDNRQLNCALFQFSYESSGFTAISLVLESASGAVTSGTFGNYSGTISVGINPNTSTTGATTIASGYVGWWRVTLASATGTGTVAGSVKCYITSPGITPAPPLPAGIATSANQTNAGQKTQVVDGGGNVVGATVNALDVNIKSPNPLPISAASLPLPAGAATAANQLNPQPISAASLPLPAGAATAANQLNPQPISAASLPLPAGAATETTLLTRTKPADTQHTDGAGAAGAALAGNPNRLCASNAVNCDDLLVVSQTNLTVNGDGLIVEKGRRRSTTNSPAVSNQATTGFTASATLIHVADCIAFSAGAIAAPAATQLTLVLRDGATGAGTIIWQQVLTIPATAAPHYIQNFCGLALKGTINTAMTLEFSALLTNEFESVSLTGYDVP